MRRRYTGEQRSALIDMVTAGQARVAEAAATLGVPATTAYGWMRGAGGEGDPSGTVDR